MKTLIVSLLLAVIAGSQAWAATIDDVEFLTRIQTYETIVNTTLVTQEGKKIPSIGELWSTWRGLRKLKPS